MRLGLECRPVMDGGTSVHTYLVVKKTKKQKKPTNKPKNKKQTFLLFGGVA